MVQKRDNLESEILLALLKAENHLRGIAKQLNESHSTVMRKTNSLINQNALDYRMEGKNKVFFIRKNLQARNLVFNAERYKLIKLLEQFPELNIIIEDIMRKGEERLIILFGSYAMFAAKKSSDIDIYIETENRKAKEEIESIHSRIRVKVGMFDQSSDLIKEIIKNHVILKGVEEFYEKIRFFD